MRGPLVALDQFMIVFGRLLAYSMNAMLARAHGGPTVTTADGRATTRDSVQTTGALSIASGNGAARRWMLVLATIPAVRPWIGMRTMPESGRWYAANPHYVDAIGSLKRIRDPAVDDIAAEVREMIDLHEAAENEGARSLSRTAPVRWTRRLLFIGIGPACFDRLTGINTAMHYLPKIRGVAQGSAVGCCRLMNAVVSWVFPVMITHVGAAWTCAVFGAINVVSLCFYLFIVLETRDTSLKRFEQGFSAKDGD